MSADVFAGAFAALFQGLNVPYFNAMSPALAELLNEAVRGPPLAVSWQAHQPFTSAHLHSALTDCSKTSAPGMDGITYSIIRKVGDPIVAVLSISPYVSLGVY